ncbi:MAG: hypothetical protein P9L92_13435 [Candidatus Electryonea clarkiae]|nr:hypothetical protein [Candidatus Electryonea clarkiae]MDP8288904.1 hypothetical protein [Candidatus Electryonea clarkiae]
MVEICQRYIPEVIKDDKPMIAAIRVDGGDIIGYGHIMRSIGLAEALEDEGFRPLFYTRLVDGAGVETLRRNGINPTVIPPDVSEEEEPDWILKHVKTEFGVPILVAVDGYHFPDDYWLRFQKNTVVLATDVFGGRNYSGVNLLYNGYAHAFQMDYSQCPEDTGLLLGPGWMITRKEVLNRKPDKPSSQPERVKRVLINGGGVDEHDVTGRVASAFANLQPEHIPDEAFFVTGINYPFSDRLNSRLEKLPFTKRLVQPDNWLDLIASSDLLLISGGQVQYEAAFFGTPYIVLLIEENQRGSAGAMQEMGITSVAGWLKDMSDDQILDAYVNICKDRKKRESFSLKGFQLLDGLGSKRVAEACLREVRDKFGK